LQEQVQARGARRAITLLVIVVLGIVAGVFFGQFYFVHELVLFVCIVVIVAFFAVNLMVLGVLFHLAGQSIFHSVRKAKPVAARRLLGEEGPVDLVKEMSLASEEVSNSGPSVGRLQHRAAPPRWELSKVAVLHAKVGTGPHRLEDDEWREGLESGAFTPAKRPAPD